MRQFLVVCVVTNMASSSQAPVQLNESSATNAMKEFLTGVTRSGKRKLSLKELEDRAAPLMEYARNLTQKASGLKKMHQIQARLTELGLQNIAAQGRGVAAGVAKEGVAIQTVKRLHDSLGKALTRLEEENNKTQAKADKLAKDSAAQVHTRKRGAILV